MANFGAFTPPTSFREDTSTSSLPFQPKRHMKTTTTAPTTQQAILTPSLHSSTASGAAGVPGSQRIGRSGPHQPPSLFSLSSEALPPRQHIFHILCFLAHATASKASNGVLSSLSLCVVVAGRRDSDGPLHLRFTSRGMGRYAFTPHPQPTPASVHGTTIPPGPVQKERPACINTSQERKETNRAKPVVNCSTSSQKEAPEDTQKKRHGCYRGKSNPGLVDGNDQFYH